MGRVARIAQSSGKARSAMMLRIAKLSQKIFLCMKSPRALIIALRRRTARPTRASGEFLPSTSAVSQVSHDRAQGTTLNAHVTVEKLSYSRWRGLGQCASLVPVGAQ